MAFLVILIGSSLTRYIGFEGIMHIREGSQSNQILSQNIYFKIRGLNETGKDSYTLDTRLSGYSGNRFSKRVKLNETNYKVVLKEVISNAMETAVPDEGGVPLVQLIAFGQNYQENILLRNEETKNIRGTRISLNDTTISDGIQIVLADTLLVIRFPVDAVTSSMMDGSVDTLKKHMFHSLQQRKIYRIGEMQLVMNNVFEKAITKWIPVPAESHSSGKEIFVFEISGENDSQQAVVHGAINQPGKETPVDINGKKLLISYGKIMITLPFSIHLVDFQLERYPGSNSPSSFASEVILIDQERNMEEPFRIFMNNILKHKGFRFYQSSYDPDEMGTVLSVNRDSWGTGITYIGYFILVLGILWSLLNKNSRFRFLARNRSGGMNKTAVFLFLLMAFSFVEKGAHGQTTAAILQEESVIPASHSKKFGNILVQDNNGRIKPVNTLASDIMRKVTKKEKFNGYHPTQLLLGMLTDPGYWQNQPVIKVGNSNLATAMGIKDKHGSMMDFIDMTRRGEYKLSAYIEEAYSKPPGKRDKFDKEVIAVDERVNICYMVFTGSLLDIFPVADDINNTWYSPEEAYMHVSSTDSLFVKNITQLYFQSVLEAVKSDDWQKPEEYLDAILTYQYRNAGIELPSRTKVRLESFYNNYNVFRKLFPFYSSLGLTLLLLLILKILLPKFNIKRLTRIMVIHLIVGFAAHTFALGLRWYVSGHAPWSNGFESMIYVAWATMLAGFIFARRSLITLAATAILASLTLLVAHFSWMNPEITNLVPVLKSYWLTFHVSIITASYGFLGLGALLGLLNLILILLKTEKNKERIQIQIADLTRINEMALILGLYFLAIGTLLGAVWANESWGRYWGWDPKETWSLITILVYVFITHMRHIPGLRSEYSFNLSSLVGFGSVLMTYFGVNYYLSGLHSYAQGDPVPIPKFLYYLLIIIFLIAVFSYSNERKYMMKIPEEADKA
jgi:cytochrome c-type biogenesis protein CcsB